MPRSPLRAFVLDNSGQDSFLPAVVVWGGAVRARQHAEPGIALGTRRPGDALPLDSGKAHPHKDRPMAKYDPLARFLADQPACRVDLSFEQIERVIQDRLPHSACQHREFWANNSTRHVHARAWLDAGWTAQAVDLTRKIVTFVRCC